MDEVKELTYDFTKENVQDIIAQFISENCYPCNPKDVNFKLQYDLYNEPQTVFDGCRVVVKVPKNKYNDCDGSNEENVTHRDIFNQFLDITGINEEKVLDYRPCTNFYAGIDIPMAIIVQLRIGRELIYVYNEGGK